MNLVIRSENRRSSWVVITFLTFGVLVALTWENYQYVIHNPGGVDFLIHWVGIRSLIFEGKSPYSEEVTREIQEIVYGRPARRVEQELYSLYPLYSGLIFAPYALIEDFQIARSLWMTTLEVVTLLLTVLSLRLVKWRPKLWLLTIVLIFSLLWYHSIRTLINGNAVMIVAFFIVGALYAIRTGRDEIAGMLLAFMTIKPNIVILFILFVIIWSCSRKRWRIIGWAIGSSLALIVLGMFFIPDWPIQNVMEVMRYPDTNPPGTVGAAFVEWWPGIGEQLSIVFTLIMSAILLREWWLALGKEFNRFLWTACLTLVISQWIGIQTDPGNFIIMFPALILVFTALDRRWDRWGRLIVLFSIITLFFGLWVLFLATVEHGLQPQQHPIMYFPIPLFLIIGLYWVRWWVIRSPRNWMDVVQDSEL